MRRRVFKTRHFKQLARKIGISDATLCKAVDEMINGLYDGDLGRQVYKKRIAIGGRGKRSGARTILATNLNSLWFFIYGFKKNARANLSGIELEALQEVAGMLLHTDIQQLEEAIANGLVEEICHDQKNQGKK